MGGADVLVNNAGVALVAPAQTLELADAHWLMNVNFWGVVHGCRAFAPQPQEQPGRAIVNVSSVFAMVSLPTQSIYNASKAAVRAFSDALREELRPIGPAGTAPHGVHVLCVHPGGIRTRIAQQARLGDISALADSPHALRRQFHSVALTSPARAAKVILRALGRRKTRVRIGVDALLGDWLFRVSPTHASALFAALLRSVRKRIRPTR
jgi:short-subunit dehydrogenase